MIDSGPPPSPGAIPSSPRALPFVPAAVARDYARVFEDRAGLAPLPLPPPLAEREGTFRDAPVRLYARAWGAAPGSAAGGAAAARAEPFARVVTIEGPQIAIVNVLGLPAGGAAPAILGIDLVALAGAPVVVVADLSPAAIAPAPAARPPADGALPAWCARWFSPRYLFARLERAAAPAALASALAFAGEWAAAVGPPAHAPAAPDTAAACAAYCRDHLEGDPGLRLLDRMFGVEWSSSFKEAVLFPSRAPNIRG